MVRRITPRPPRKKSVKVQFVPRPESKQRKSDPAEPYGYLDRHLKHHEHLSECKIALAWMLDVKPDQDGHLTLGRCRKASDLDREFREFDFVILLNSTAWKAFSELQRAALMDHELHHAGLALNKKTGDPIEDERGRKCYRIRGHDLEEFRGVVKRHGLYKSDLELFARTCQEAPLFKAEIEKFKAEIESSEIESDAAGAEERKSV